MRIFKTKALARFTKRERISDTSLTEAIENAERGLVDADLGGGVIKQRVARLGHGIAKSELDNIDDDQLATLREIAAAWLAADDKKISQAIKDRLLIEVQHGD